MARSLDEIFPELQRARRDYEAAATAAERAALSQVLDRLRAEARAAAGDPLTHLSDRELAQRIRRARERLDDIAARRMSTGHISVGGDSGGVDPVLVARHNAELDRTMSRAEIERELQGLLAEKRRRDG